MVKGFWLDCWLAEDCRFAGVTETLGGICGFFEDGSDGSGKVFCSFAADKPSTISSNFLRFFSLPITGSSIVCNKTKLSGVIYLKVII